MANEIDYSDPSTINGNQTISGNLDVGGQVAAKSLKIVDEKYQPVIIATDKTTSFRNLVEFTEPVTFNKGTVIGIEKTYNSPYVGTSTLQAGERLIIGDSAMKIDNLTKKILADTFEMSVSRLTADIITSAKSSSDLVEAKKVKVTEEIIGKTIYADVIKGNKFAIESIAGLNLTTAGNLTTQSLFVEGSSKIKTDLIVSGVGVNGAALTVNGGQIVANYGMLSKTRNNDFQCLKISGSGAKHDVCFRVDKDVDSLFEGDVTIQDSRLVLDGSQLVSDEVVVTKVSDSNNTTGFQITTRNNWDTYELEMVDEVSPKDSFAKNEYDPYASVMDAIERNQSNYQKAELTIKSIVNPISYAMEQNDGFVPKKFSVKHGIFRADSNGNAMFRNVVSEQGKFSTLSAHNLMVNKMKIDKVVTTSVASNVVHTDNLLKSEGIAEFDGVVNSSADIFIESGSKVNVSEGADVTFRNGSSLKLMNGSKFEMAGNTSFNVKGNMEIDVSRLVFKGADGNKYRISFREATCCEGEGVVMEYFKVEDEPTQTIVERSTKSALELDAKLKSLGL